MKWIAVQDAQPERGERVAVCNALREWITEWNPALVTAYQHWPVTHWARYGRPYPPRVEDRTRASVQRDSELRALLQLAARARTNRTAKEQA